MSDKPATGITALLQIEESTRWRSSVCTALLATMARCGSSAGLSYELLLQQMVFVVGAGRTWGFSALMTVTVLPLGAKMDKLLARSAMSSSHQATMMCLGRELKGSDWESNHASACSI